MKINWLVGSVFLAGTMVLRAQTNDLSAALRQGLFEEEANRNLAAAISNYQSLATQFDRDRQIAATAIFRLGECYRKLGKTNDAVVQYERIVREFPDQQTLATLSRQNLTGLGTISQTSLPGTTAAESMAKASELEAEAAALKAQIERFSSFKRDDSRIVVQQNFPNPVLSKLMQDLTEAEQKLAGLTNDYAPQSLQVVNATTLVNTINGQIDAQVDGVIKGLQVKMEAELNAAKALRDKSGPVQAVHAETSTVTDDEDREIQRIQQLIQNSPDLINADRGDGAPLFGAAGRGQLRVAGFLLDHGANIEGANHHVPLLAAAMSGNRAMVELLLSRGADVNAKIEGVGTALHQAAQQGFQAVVEVLLANHADVNALDTGGATALCMAASSGQLKIVQMLLDAGANPNVKDIGGRTPLNYAIAVSPPVFQALLKAGTDANTEDSHGRTPLSYAVEKDGPMIVKMLLAAKADPNGGKLDAPLLCAIHKPDAVSAELLLQAGANPNAKGSVDWRGWATPLWFAIDMNQLPMVQLLLKFKADPNDFQIDGHPLLFDALNNNDILEALLNAGGKVDLRNSNGWPLLNAAIWGINPAIVQTLLQHGADVNIRNGHGGNEGGYTPLHVAAERLVDHKFFEILLDDKADPNIRSDSGMTPLDLVKEKLAQYVDPQKKAAAGQLAELLRQHGALDKLPNWDRIEVSRPSANFSASFFWKGTNDWNQFTLLEVLARQYELLQHATRGTWNIRQTTIRDFWDKNPCRFPDLQRVLIHRPSPDGRRWTILTVDVAKLLQTGDCSMDQPMQWGDVVEIPETDHPVSEQWGGLGPDELGALLKCITRRITISLKGTNSTLTLSPVCVPNNSFFGDGTANGSYVHGLDMAPVSYALRSVLEQSKLVRASSDLSRVKVTRHDSKTGKKHEWMLDCSGGNDPNLWLRDGDVIEVPEKP